MAGAGAAAGGLFSLIGSIGKYGVSQSLAEEQATRAEQLRNDARNVKAQAIRPEYQDVLKLKALQILNGSPAYDAQNDEVELSGANYLQSGKQSVTSGDQYLDYAATLYNAENKAKRDIKAQDTTYRAGAINEYAGTLSTVGQERQRLQDEAQARKDAILVQSAALEKAATQNKYQGKSDAIGNISADLASMAGGAMGGGKGGSAGKGGTGGTQGGGGADGASSYNTADDPEFDTLVTQLLNSGQGFNVWTAQQEAQKQLGRQRH